MKNPKFEKEIRKQIGSSIDTSELDKEYDGLKDRLSQTTGAKNRLADQMDHLSVSDKNYDCLLYTSGSLQKCSVGNICAN